MRQDRRRLDEELVLRGLAPSRARARDMVKRGTVSIDGKPEIKPARMVEAEQVVAVADSASRYVSRSALKLATALDAFKFDPTGLSVLDIGASTGGFTQVLLERGAAHVVAIDVGHGELDRKLAVDPRVTLIEGLNARYLNRTHLSARKIGALVADVSFISLKLALPPALNLAEPRAWGVFLVKPQFEVGRRRLGKGGVVRDARVARRTVDEIAAWLEDEPGWSVTGIIPSPIEGGSGNREFLIGARHG